MTVKKSSEKRRRIEESDDILIRPVSDVVRVKSFVVYGRAGTGKTTFASSFPKPMLLLDIKDEGTDSIADVPDIDVVDVFEWETLEKVYDHIKANPKKYKTVVLDTMTQLQQLAVEKVMKDQKKSVENAGAWGSMTKQDWGKVAQEMKKWIVLFRDLPCETVFLAQERIFNMEDEGSDTEIQLDPEIGPRLSPSVVSTLNAAVSFIGNTYIRNYKYVKKIDGKKIKKERIEYCLGLGPSPWYIRKVRKVKNVELPLLIVDPDYDSLMDAIKGE